jgi:hypothetical protein
VSGRPVNGSTGAGGAVVVVAGAVVVAATDVVVELVELVELVEAAVDGAAVSGSSSVVVAGLLDDPPHAVTSAAPPARARSRRRDIGEAVSIALPGSGNGVGSAQFVIVWSSQFLPIAGTRPRPRGVTGRTGTVPPPIAARPSTPSGAPIRLAVARAQGLR